MEIPQGALDRSNGIEPEGRLDDVSLMVETHGACGKLEPRTHAH